METRSTLLVLWEFIESNLQKEAVFLLMLLGFTICTAMFGNGALTIGMEIIKMHPGMKLYGFIVIKLLT